MAARDADVTLSSRDAHPPRHRRVPRQGADDRRLPRRRLRRGVERRPHPRSAEQGVGRAEGAAGALRQARRGRRARVRAVLRRRRRQEARRLGPQAEAPRRRRAPARNGRGSGGGGDRLASEGGAEAQGPGAPHGLPRDHEGRDQARARRDEGHRRTARRRPGDPSHPRSPLRVRGLTGALEEGDASPFGRPGAVRRHPARGRARARADAVRRRPVLGRARHLRARVVRGPAGRRGWKAHRAGSRLRRGRLGRLRDPRARRGARQRARRRPRRAGRSPSARSTRSRTRAARPPRSARRRSSRRRAASCASRPRRP